MAENFSQLQKVGQMSDFEVNIAKNPSYVRLSDFKNRSDNFQDKNYGSTKNDQISDS